MIKPWLLVMTLLLGINAVAQDNDNMKDLPYYEVPDYYESFTAGTVAARMVDGLGFRYRWATEDLREVDLNYKPTDSSRTTMQTIDHILGLSRTILNATLKVPSDFTIQQPELTYEQKRKETLENIKKASEILQKATSLIDFNMHFISNRGESEYPFWNSINGPIADAIWHTGQVTLLRRASGNPISKKVSFLQGKIRE
jgi:uncharacterized damage-inducible protein DinB